GGAGDNAYSPPAQGTADAPAGSRAARACRTGAAVPAPRLPYAASLVILDAVRAHASPCGCRAHASRPGKIPAPGARAARYAATHRPVEFVLVVLGSPV